MRTPKRKSRTMRRADLVVRTNEENTEATMGRWAVRQAFFMVTR